MLGVVLVCLILFSFSVFGQKRVFSECGNGRVEGNEQCDDGNLVGGDGCSPECVQTDFYFACDDIGIASGAVGMAHSNLRNIFIDLPGDPVKGLLFWELRGGGDEEILLDNQSIFGDILGEPLNHALWWANTYSYQSDVTSLLSGGMNRFLISGLRRESRVTPNAAALLVVHEDDSRNEIFINSKNDFFWHDLPASPQSDIVIFSFDPEDESRSADLIIMTGDAQPVVPEGNQLFPRTDRIWFESGSGTQPLDIIGSSVLLGENVLESSYGPEADIFEASVVVPAGADYIALQIESPERVNESIGDSVVWISSALSLECLPCLDEDEDGVCDDMDRCLGSKKGEPVDEHGCDIFQFCSVLSCGGECERGDWKGNEPNEDFPNDCKVVIPHNGGILQQPICVPTEFSDGCAG